MLVKCKKLQSGDKFSAKKRVIEVKETKCNGKAKSGKNDRELIGRNVSVASTSVRVCASDCLLPR